MCFNHEIGWKELDYRRTVSRQVGRAAVSIRQKERYNKDQVTFRLLAVAVNIAGVTYNYELFIERDTTKISSTA